MFKIEAASETNGTWYAFMARLTGQVSW